MKTFQEFIELAEKYYEPIQDELPSGKTPYEKATEKAARRNSNLGPNSNIERMKRHNDKIETKVRQGADNPDYNYNTGNDDHDVEVTNEFEGGLRVHHHPTGITYHVSNEDGGVHTITWNHDHGNKTMLSRKQRLKIANDAKRVWHQHVSHRLPYGDIAHNTPVMRLGNKIEDRRSRIYQRTGFGPTDSDNNQFARIGREPSPKQKAKGKSRLKPMDPKEMGWDQ